MGDIYKSDDPVPLGDAVELYHFAVLLDHLRHVLVAYSEYPETSADLGRILSLAVRYHELLPLVVAHPGGFESYKNHLERGPSIAEGFALGVQTLEPKTTAPDAG